MNIKDIFLTASGNMFRSKVRTVLTILAIFVGAFTLTLTNGLGAGVATYIDRQVSNLGQEALVIITPKVEMATTKSPQEYEPGTINGGGARPGEQVTYLTQGDADKLRQYDGITNVELIYVTSPDYIQGASDKKYQLTASPNPASTRLDLAAGEQLATDTDENQLVIPIEYVTPLGYADANAAINQQVTLAVTDGAGERHDVLATIVGVQQEGPLSAGGMAMSTALKTALYDLQSRGLPAATKDRYQGVAAEMKGDLTDQRVADIKSALDVMGYTAQTIDDQLGVIQTVISAITYVLSGFAVVALLAAGFGIVNTL